MAVKYNHGMAKSNSTVKGVILMKKNIFIGSSLMVAVSTIAFVLLLIFTFDRSGWEGIIWKIIIK